MTGQQLFNTARATWMIKDKSAWQWESASGATRALYVYVSGLPINSSAQEIFNAVQAAGLLVNATPLAQRTLRFQAIYNFFANQLAA